MEKLSFRERRLEIVLATLEREQRVNVVELSDTLGVSTESIRRDLWELESRGLARRVYGGAVLIRKTADLPFSDRSRVKRREKAKIGRAAAQLIGDDMKIFVGTGTTMLEAVKALRNRRNLTVVSNSIAIVNELAGAENLNVHTLSGRVNYDYQAVYGYETLDALNRHHFDVTLIGGTAVDLTYGLMDTGEDQAVLHRQALKQASKTVLLADDSKFSRSSPIRTASFDEIDTIITNGPVLEDYNAVFEAHGVEVICV